MSSALELNRHITNGVSTRSGEYISIQLAGISSKTSANRYLSISGPFSARNILRHAILSVICLRRDQIFYDGNHRTALLLMYEVLAQQRL